MNGVSVSELVLGAGDRIELGDSVIVVEVAGDGDLMDGRSCSSCGRPDPLPGPAYLVLARIVRALLRDLRAAAREPGRRSAGSSSSPRRAASPPSGASFDLDAITTLGRDVNNAIVIDDPFASADHAALTYRGRSWYVEDLG